MDKDKQNPHQILIITRHRGSENMIYITSHLNFAQFLTVARYPLSRLWQLAERMPDTLHVTTVIFNDVVSMAQIRQTTRPHFRYYERRNLRI